MKLDIHVCEQCGCLYRYWARVPQTANSDVNPLLYRPTEEMCGRCEHAIEAKRELLRQQREKGER